jgi:NitT/TauT family transport system permease protein
LLGYLADLILKLIMNSVLRWQHVATVQGKA